MIYPAAVIVLAVVAVAVIMVVVIPQFENIFLGLLGPGEPTTVATRMSPESAVSWPDGGAWSFWLSSLLQSLPFASTIKRPAAEGQSTGSF